jgi:hypothetical protein
MKELIREDWNYILYEQEQGFLFSVTCGTVAIFEISIVLNTQEVKHFQEQGQAFLQTLADRIRDNPNEYLNRRY